MAYNNTLRQPSPSLKERGVGGESSSPLSQHRSGDEPVVGEANLDIFLSASIGRTATFDELNKFFAISGMPIASGQYWNGIHGNSADDAEQDGEGLQMMRTLARNMVFLMKSIALGKEQFGLPEKEPPVRTNFIR